LVKSVDQYIIDIEKYKVFKEINGQNEKLVKKEWRRGRGSY